MDLKGLQGLEQCLTVDTSEARPTYLLKSRNGHYLKLSSSAYSLLRQLSRGATYEELAQELTQKQGNAVTPADIERAFLSVMESIERIDGRQNHLPYGFWFKKRLLPAAQSQRVSNLLSGAFRWQLALILLCCTGGAMGWVILQGGPPHLTSTGFLQGYGLFIGSLIMHELGHASACRRFGALPHDIGFTFYLIYPSFYSDVSDAWRLKRWQRVVVDVAGVYFQLFTGALYVVAWAISGWAPFQGAVWMVLASCVFSLNPFFKFDGYWLVADALGITNLGRQPQRIIQHFINRLRGRPAPALPWSPRMLNFLVGYSLLSVAVWGWFLARLAPMLGRYLRELPQLLTSLLTLPLPQLAGVLQSLLIRAYMLLALGLLLFRLIQPGIGYARRKLARAPVDEPLRSDS